MKEPNKFHNYEIKKITRKASDTADYIRVVWFFHPRSSCMMHLMLFSERPPMYASSCIMICHRAAWKNQTIPYNCRFSATSMALRVIFVRRKRLPIYASCMMILGGRTEQQVVTGFGEVLQSIRIHRHSFSTLTE